MCKGPEVVESSEWLRNREVRLEWKEVKFGKQTGKALQGLVSSVRDWDVELRAMASHGRVLSRGW